MCALPSELSNAEWLETDGLGGFACMPVAGPRTRRYHGLLVSATNPPADRSVLLNGFDAWITTAAGRFQITQQRYAGESGDVLDPATPQCEIECFKSEPWPRWIFRLPGGTRFEHEVFIVHGSPTVAMSWRLLTAASPRESRDAVTLSFRPFLSVRNYHALHRENSGFRFAPLESSGDVAWQPYQSMPEIRVRSNGRYRHEPLWYRNFRYAEEQARGFDSVEDLASPGEFHFDLIEREAACIVSADQSSDAILLDGTAASNSIDVLRRCERVRRAAFPTPLHRAADQYLVKRREGRSIIAGYPWFADWGRDTFIAMRGLCIATGRLREALQILLAWSHTISCGMLPNRFPDSSSGGGADPEYNSVDASLWYVIAVHDFLEATRRERLPLSDADQSVLIGAVREVLAGYSHGTRYGIRRDPDDGLLMAGEAGQQLTWMDARVGDHEVTPRIGKPVEVNALWCNALWIGSRVLSQKWRDAFEFARASFRRRFWNAGRGCLYDVVDADHRRGNVDDSIRPNQIYAVGGLPMSLLADAQARSVVEIVERELWTPRGLRSLSRHDARFVPRYVGGPQERDAAYHQGTVWPFLAGAFIEAHARVNGWTDCAKLEARKRFLHPLMTLAQETGMGHVSEIADAELPHTPRGCPLQAWSIGELLRADMFLKVAPLQPEELIAKHEQSAGNLELETVP